jgi:hypothetical protein
MYIELAIDTNGTITRDSVIGKNSPYLYIDTVGNLNPSTEYFVRFKFIPDTGSGSDSTLWYAFDTQDSSDTSDSWLFDADTFYVNVINLRKNGLDFEIYSSPSDSVFISCTTSSSIIMDTLVLNGKDTVSVNNICYNTLVKYLIHTKTSLDTVYDSTTTLNLSQNAIRFNRAKNVATTIPILLLSNPVDSCMRKYQGSTISNNIINAWSFNWDNDSTILNINTTNKFNPIGTTGIWLLNLSASEMNPNSGLDSLIKLYIDGDEIDRTRRFEILLGN